jgi:hypothetical protein
VAATVFEVAYRRREIDGKNVALYHSGKFKAAPNLALVHTKNYCVWSILSDNSL